MASEETTTKLNVDISELKKSMQDAKRAVSVANSEFKASVSTLENWSNTTEGVSAKIKQLNSNVKSHEQILDALEQQYKAVVAEQGENSKAAQNLEIRINNQKATVNKTAMELKKYENQLQTLESEQKKLEQETEKQISTYDKLKNTISEQETELANLKKEYANTALEQGKNSDSARELAGKIENLSSELSANKTIMKNVDKAADDLDESLDDVGDAAEKTKEGFTIMKAAIADLMADGLKALAQTAKECMQELAFETEQAYDTFQAKTGTATEAMGEFKDKIDDLYRNNYGESITDISNAMAEVKQQTKEVDPSKLQELTKYAIVLRDTFEFDVRESMRSVNMLMDQFGISGEEAFNLIVQGAQKGLDKNGDLLDTINEYGVHYKQLGYDSEDFFNSLVNGAETGTFSVDKLGDAVKEFGIRTKDTAQSTTEGFELIGLSADDMRKEFAKGGDSAQKATKKTLKALFELDDEVKQNQAGVALFGTMWEDLGIDGVKALMNTEGALKKTNQAMKELDQVKYDNVANKFSQIGRSLQINFLLPLAQKALPTIEKFANKFIADGDKIINTLKVIGTVIAAVFVVNKIAKFVQSVSSLVSTYRKLKTALTAATTAQTALNAAQTSSGWGAILTAIGLVVGGIITYISSTNDAKSETEKFCEKIKESSEEMREQAEAYREAEEARSNTLKGISSEYSYYEDLVDELANITDENGKVVKGYESRAQVITGLLSDALGTEITTDQLVAQGKQNVIDKIKELIEVQKAEAMLEAYKSDHLEALKQREKAYETYIARKKEAVLANEELANAEKALADYQKTFDEMTYKTEEDYAAYSVQVKNLTGNIDKCKEAQKNANQAVEDAHGVYLGYQNTIETYNGVSAAIIEGDSAKINEALALMTYNFKTAENSTRDMLWQQVVDARENLALLKQALKDGEPGITQQMVDNAQIWVNRSVEELDKLTPQAAASAATASQKFVNVMDNYVPMSELAAQQNAQAAAKGFGSQNAQAEQAGTTESQYFVGGVEDVMRASEIAAQQNAQAAAKGFGSQNAESKQAGTTQTQEYADGVEAVAPESQKAAEKNAEATTQGFSSQNAESKAVGKESGDEYASGVSSKAGATETAAKNVAQKGKSGMASVDTTGTGRDFTQGFINGMGSLLSSVWSKAKEIGSSALSALKNAIKSKSPAKETIKLGEYFGEGFVIGIEKLISDSQKVAETLGEKTLATLKDSIEQATEFYTDEANAMLDSEKFYLAEKERIEKEKAEAEYQEKLKNAKTAEEIEKAKQEKIKQEQEEANQAYLDGLKETADKEKEIYKKRADSIKAYVNDYVDKAEAKFNEFVDNSVNKLNEFKSLQESIVNSLNGSGNNTFSTVTFISGDSSETFTKLADVGGDNKTLGKYSALLDKLAERTGGLPAEIASFLSEMDITDGMAYVEALLNSSDKEFDAYISGLEEKERLSGEIASKITSTQAKALHDEIMSEAGNIQNELMSMAEGIPEALGELGVEGADSFGSAFLSEMTAILNKVNEQITLNLGHLISGLKSNLATANLNLSGATASLSGGSVGGAVYNYTQVINSPSPVNRLELYRHGKNLLGLKGGVSQYVLIKS